MKRIQGSVAVQETGAGVTGVTVVVFARGDEGASVRVGSVATDARGEFRLEVDGAKFVWDLRLEIQATAPKPTVIYADAEARVGAGDVETWTIRIPTATLTSAGLLRPPSTIARELPALGSVIARTLANQSMVALPANSSRTACWRSSTVRRPGRARTSGSVLPAGELASELGDGGVIKLFSFMRRGRLTQPVPLPEPWGISSSWKCQPLDGEHCRERLADGYVAHVEARAALRDDISVAGSNMEIDRYHLFLVELYREAGGFPLLPGATT